MSSTPLQAGVLALGARSGRIRGRGPMRLAWARLRRDRVAMASIAVLALMALFALAAPLLAGWTGHSYDHTYPVTGLDPIGQPVGPGRGFWLGADQLGRDVLVRAAYGARVSLVVALGATSLATVLGITVGLVSGFAGGVADSLLAVFMDFVLALPYILVAIVLATTFRLTSVAASLTLTILAIGFFSFATIGRVVRAKVLSLKEADFVAAARSIGAGRARIIFVDVLPNLAAEVTVLASLTVPMSIVFEASMSFLGVGVRPPMPSWGSMLGEGAEVFATAWWLLAVPSALLLLTTFSCTLLGDGIRCALTGGGPGRARG
ncbi:MAG: transporter permease [Streptosporangiaceae bacterium]|jgi:ABC-type dipeptide/oligopeptide/nickel transport system permease subunit|nr:transporter permease [Streptosporangiaceae bacterium]